MADRLSLALLAALCVPSLAWAQNGPAPLADPTRPPPGFSPAPEASAEAPPRVLQSVLIPSKGKALAVIDGQVLSVGQRYGDSRLIRVSEREAVLEGPQGIERLRLTPGVEKTNIGTRQPKGGVKSEPAAHRTVRNEG